MTTLVTWLWQGLAIVAATAVALRAMPRWSASTRHAIWWIALGLVLVHPWTPSAVPFEPAPALVDAALVAAPVVSAPASGWHAPAPPDWAVTCLAALWCAWVVWCLTRIAVSLHALRALKITSRPFDAARQARLPLWQQSQRAGRPCRLVVSDEVTGAWALGFFEPAIVIQRALAQQLSDADLDLVIAHEHAHLVRRDDWLQLLHRAIDAVAGLHPAVALIGRQIALERESACDDRVLTLGGAAPRYARCLATVAAMVGETGASRASLSPAMAGGAALLRARLQRLLAVGRNHAARIGWRPTAAVAAALAALVVICDQAPPVITFVRAADAIKAARPIDARPSSPASEPARATLVLRDAGPEQQRAATTEVSPAAADSVGAAARRESAPRARSAAPRPAAFVMQSVPLAITSARVPATTPLPVARVELSSVADSQGLPALPTSTRASSVGIPVLPPPAASSITPSTTTSTTTSTSVADDADGWSAFGSKVAHAGVSVGKTTGRAGQAIGRWFAKAPWLPKKTPAMP